MKKCIILLIAGICTSLIVLACSDTSKNDVPILQTGSSGDLNVSGTVEHGNYLSLVHNLNRDDLTFTGQFLKDGYIYNYSDYNDMFGKGMTTRIGPTVFSTSTFSTIASSVESNISAITLSNGNVLIAYRDEGRSGYGTFVTYDPSGNLVAGPQVFSRSSTENIKPTQLAGGNVLFAYRDAGNHDYGTFVIYNVTSTSGMHVGQKIFNNAGTTSISAITLSNRNILIAYIDGGNTNSGTFVIYDALGNAVYGEQVFNGYTNAISATTLSNGNALLVYDNGGEGNTVVYDVSENDLSNSYVFYESPVLYPSAISLSNGNALIAYQENFFFSGSFVICNSIGLPFPGKNVFYANLLLYHSETRLSSGNVLFAFADYETTHGNFLIFNQSGDWEVGPIVFNAAGTENISATTLSNCNAFIAYSDGGNSNQGTFKILGKKSLEIQKVSSNEIRFWNYSGETLDLTLSVD